MTKHAYIVIRLEMCYVDSSELDSTLITDDDHNFKVSHQQFDQYIIEGTCTYVRS